MAEVQKPAPILQPDVLAQYNHQALPDHPHWGGGIRFRFGTTLVDYFPAPSNLNLTPTVTLRGMPNERGRRTKTEIPGVTEVMPTTELEPVTGHGLYVMAQNDEVLVTSTGRYHHRHFANVSDAPVKLLTHGMQEPITTLQTQTDKPEQDDTEQKEHQPRVKVTGFFGKVLEGFPRHTEDGGKMYKLLLGKEVRQPDESRKTVWTIVTAAKPHVVKFLEENLTTFEPRKTVLKAEGYWQEQEAKPDSRRKIPRRELYALNMIRVPQS